MMRHGGISIEKSAEASDIDKSNIKMSWLEKFNQAKRERWNRVLPATNNNTHAP